MYEKFTDRARKVLYYARSEAERYSSRVINTEHLLYGLAREGTGVGAHVLERAGLTATQVRDAINGNTKGPSNSDVLPAEIKQSVVYDRVVAAAAGVAEEFGDQHIGTEHLLVALVREDESSALHILKRHSAHPWALELDVKAILGIAAPDGKLTTVEELWEEVARLHRLNAKHVKRRFRLQDRTPMQAVIHLASEVAELAAEYAADPQVVHLQEEEAADVILLLIHLLQLSNHKLERIVEVGQTKLATTFET
jgi:ATP-dependent Clp protease ATP-binding subunit ClpA